jgi:hypothetical protein
MVIRKIVLNFGDLIYLVFLLITADASWTLNGTGSNLASNVYQEVSFAFQFNYDGDIVNYFGFGSLTGKCNIMVNF